MLHVVPDRNAATLHWEKGERAITWSELQSRLLALDSGVSVASSALERLLLEPILASALPEKVAVLSPSDPACKRWLDSAHYAIHTQLEGIENTATWIEEGASSLVAKLRALNFVARAGLSQHLLHLVNKIDVAVLARAIGASELHAAPTIVWSASGLALWSALKRRLDGLCNVSASVYTLDLPLDALATKTPFDRFADLYDKLTGEPPSSALVDAVFGNLTLTDQREPNDAVAIVRAVTKQAWRESIVNCVNDALRRGIAPEEIAIVYANQESARQAVRQLEAEGLRVCTSGKKASSLLIDRVHALLDMASRSFRPEELGRCLGTTSNLKAAARVLSQRRFVEGQDVEMLEALQRDADAVDSVTRVERILRTIAALRSPGAPNEHAARLLDALASMGPEPSLPSSSEKPQHSSNERAHLRSLAREQAAMRIVDDVLHEVAQAFLTIRTTDVSFEAFANLVRASLPREVPVMVGSRISAIQVVTIGAVTNARAVLIIDARRDEFPSSPKRTASEAQQSADVHTLLQVAQWTPVMRALESAGSITFIFAAQSDDGSAAEPSRLLRWLDHNHTRTSTTFAKAPQPPHETDRRVLQEDARAQSFFGLNASLEEPRDRIQWATRLGAATGELAQAPMRVTLLEPILSCAFAGFASAVLRARRDDRAHSDPDPRELGRLRHAALEAAFVETLGLWRERPRNEEAIVSQGVSAARTLLQHELGSRAALMIDRVAKECGDLLRQSVNDLDWDFALAEQPFDGSAWPTYVLARGSERVHLSGRIDRIDLSHEGSKLRIVDYKSATSSADDARRKPLQLLVYASVCKQELGLTDAEGLYWPVRARTVIDKRGISLDDRALLDEALEATLTLRSHLPRADGAPATCDKCSFDLACRKPRYVVSGLLEDKGES